MLSLICEKKELSELLDSQQNMQVLGKGFQFLEGPIWRDGALTFSDIPASLLYRWHETKGLEIVRMQTNKGNGNVFDHAGNIISCEHITSRLVRFGYDGNDYEILADHFHGKELNSPNDVVVKRDGTIYFTDPRFGRNPSMVGLERPLEQEEQRVYFLKAGDQEPRVACEGLLVSPNGLCFSEDESKMYIADTPSLTITVYDVCEDGTLTNPKLFATTQGEGAGRPDGLKIYPNQPDVLVCAAQGGLHFYTTAGVFLGILQVPEQAANFCFGDADGCGLYITASTTLYKVRMKKKEDIT